MCLLARQLLWLAEVREILMVCEESYRVGHALEIMSPMIQGMDNGEELLIIDIVVPLCRGEHLREVGTGVKVTVIILLHEDSATGQERGISHNDERMTDIWEVKYWSHLKCGQYRGEGSLLIRSPGPGVILLSEGGNGGNCVGETRDEATIEVAKTQE